MQQIYKTTSMLKCDFNKIATQQMFDILTSSTATLKSPNTITLSWLEEDKTKFLDNFSKRVFMFSLLGL